MTDLMIVGAGGLGRETLFQLREAEKLSPQFRILGFADDGKVGQTVHGLPVLCGTQALSERKSETAVVLAVGKPAVRRRLYALLRNNPHLSFPTVIAPNVVYADSVSFGMGCIVGFGATITVDIRIGDFVLVSNSCNIGHDAVLEDYVTLYPAVHVSGNVHLGTGCEVGVGSNIIQGLAVGEETILGAGCTVVRDIPPHCTAVGVPARVIRANTHSV